MLYQVFNAANVALLTVRAGREGQEEEAEGEREDELFVRVSRHGRDSTLPFRGLPGLAATEGKVAAAAPPQSHPAYSAEVAEELGYAGEGGSDGATGSARRRQGCDAAVVAVPVFSELEGRRQADTRTTSPRAADGSGGPRRGALGRDRRLSIHLPSMSDLEAGEGGAEGGAKDAAPTAPVRGGGEGGGEAATGEEHTPPRRVIAVLLVARGVGADPARRLDEEEPALGRAMDRRAAAFGSSAEAAHFAPEARGGPSPALVAGSGAGGSAPSRRHRARPFTRRDQDILYTVARQIGFAMEHRQFSARAAAARFGAEAAQGRALRDRAASLSSLSPLPQGQSPGKRRSRSWRRLSLAPLLSFRGPRNASRSRLRTGSADSLGLEVEGSPAAGPDTAGSVPGTPPRRDSGHDGASSGGDDEGGDTGRPSTALTPASSVQSPLRVRATRVYLPPTAVAGARFVTVTMSLFHGRTLLCRRTQTGSAALADCGSEEEGAAEEEGGARGAREALWGDGEEEGGGGGDLCAPMQIRNLPRSTRVVFEVWASSQAGALAEEEAPGAASSGVSGDGGSPSPSGKKRGVPRRGLSRRPSVLGLESGGGRSEPVGWALCTALTFTQALRSGRFDLALWPGSCDFPMSTSGTNDHEAAPARLEVEFPQRARPIIYGSDAHLFDASGRAAASAAKNSRVTHPEEVARILVSDVLAPMTEEQRQIIWANARALVSLPSTLPKVARSVPWGDAGQVAEFYRLLHLWAMPSPHVALQLLDHETPDPKVRAFAVQCLEQLPDEELRQYLLQLTQVLKYERYHDSALARFLLRRALLRPRYMGHMFFWMLKSEIHVPDVAARFGVLLEAYLHNCGSHRGELGHQRFVLTRLEEVTRRMQTEAADLPKADAVSLLHSALAEIVFPERFQLPLSPDKQCRGAWAAWQKGPPSSLSSPLRAQGCWWTSAASCPARRSRCTWCSRTRRRAGRPSASSSRRATTCGKTS